MDPKPEWSLILEQAEENIKTICDYMHDNGIKRARTRYNPSRKEVGSIADKAAEVAQKYHTKVPNQLRPLHIAMASIFTAGIVLDKDYISKSSIVYTASACGFKVNISTAGAIQRTFEQMQQELYPNILKVSRGRYRLVGSESEPAFANTKKP